MKRAVLILLTALLALGTEARVSRFGVTGGLNFPTTTKYADLSHTPSIGWDLGLVYQINLGKGFCIQPELMYDRQTGSEYSTDVLSFVDYSSDNLGLPINIQWGPELGLLGFRPFVELSPFISCSLANAFEGDFDNLYSVFDDVSRFSYGLGLGFGFDIWKLQLKFRYTWNLASFSSGEKVDNIVNAITQNTCDGFNLSLAVFLF